MDSITAAAFRLSGGVGAETWAGLVATAFPEFIARDGQERADGSRQGGKLRVVRPAAHREHGPARLDGARPRATVADRATAAALAQTPRKRSAQWQESLNCFP